MPDNEIVPVILEGNPGVEDSGTSVPDDAGNQTDPPQATAPATSTGPTPEYKGLQKVLDREQRRRQEAEAEVERLRSAPAGGNDPRLVQALIAEVAQHDPQKAQQLSLAYMQYAQAQENATLRNRLQGQDLERQLEQIEARNMEELREVASALGVSPDSPMVDYGDQNDSIADRLASVRASAKIAVKPATPVVAPSRTGDAVHNTQPAMPAPARTANSGRVTAEQLEAAAASYARNYSDATKRAAAEVTLRELQEKFATQEL